MGVNRDSNTILSSWTIYETFDRFRAPKMLGRVSAAKYEFSKQYVITCIVKNISSLVCEAKRIYELKRFNAY